MLTSGGEGVFFENLLLEEPVLTFDSTNRPPGDTALATLVGTAPGSAEDRAQAADALRPLRSLAMSLISSVVSGFISVVDWLSDSFSN